MAAMQALGMIETKGLCSVHRGSGCDGKGGQRDFDRKKSMWAADW